MENLHLRFQKARKKLIDKQLDLGKIIGMSQTDISYIENGKAKNINPNYLYYLLKRGISWTYLFEAKGSMFTKDEYNNEKINIAEEENIELININKQKKTDLEKELEFANKKIEYLEKLINDSVKQIIDRIDFK